MVFADRKETISGGNFHGEYPAKVHYVFPRAQGIWNLEKMKCTLYKVLIVNLFWYLLHNVYTMCLSCVFRKQSVQCVKIKTCTRNPNSLFLNIVFVSIILSAFLGV